MKQEILALLESKKLFPGKSRTDSDLLYWIAGAVEVLLRDKLKDEVWLQEKLREVMTATTKVSPGCELSLADLIELIESA